VKINKPSNNVFSRYTRATTDIKPRIIAASIGEVGTGKTSWWLGAPPPIVVQTLDQGLEGVVETYAADKEIYIAEYDLGVKPGEDFTHEAAVTARDKFVEDYEHALQHARTIVWDRHSDMWDLFYYAEFGTDDAYGAAPPKDWDRLKGKIRRLIAMAKAGDVNLGIIQGLKDQWGTKVNNKTGKEQMTKTGNRIPAGMEGIDALVHIVLTHQRADGQFSLSVGKSRGPGSADVQDHEFDITPSFTEFAMMVYPETEESDWK
jgi:hypothetical protein